MTASIRSFLAVDIPAPSVRAIKAIVQPLEGQLGQTVRWIADQNLHLTLHFLGYLAPKDLNGLLEQLRQVNSSNPFYIQVHQFAPFPPSKQTLIVAKISPSTELSILYNETLKIIRSRLPIAPSHPFYPHISIARSKQKLLFCPLRAKLKIKIDTMTLYQSKLLTTGAQYHPIERYSL